MRSLEQDYFITPCYVMTPFQSQQMFFVHPESLNYAPADAKFTALHQIRHLRCFYHGHSSYITATPLPSFADDEKLNSSWLRLRSPTEEGIDTVHSWKEGLQSIAFFLRAEIFKALEPGTYVEVDASCKSADCAGKLGKVLLAAERSTENADLLIQLDGVAEPVRIESVALKIYPRYVQYLTLAEMSELVRFQLALLALAAGSNVDFPTVTEICDRVAKEPREVPEAVRLLAGAFAEKGGLPRRKLKALTIMNELLYDKRAEAELRQVHGVRDALWTLQTTSNSGLGPEADEQIRMFATEVEKKCFGASGDPFADPFTLPVVNSVPAPAPLGALSPAKDSMKDVGSSMLGALWQVGSQMTSAVKATAPRVEIPRFAMRPGASRPNLDVSFEGVLPGEKVHNAFNPSVLLINKPFREVQGRLLISNYRLKFQVPKGTWKDNLAWIGEKQLLDIPLGLVEVLELEAPTSQAGAQQWRLVVSTKDFRSIVVLLPTGKDLGEAEEAILALSQPGPAYTSALFAFQHAACLQTGRRDDGWSLFDPRMEFERMEVEASPSSASGCPWLLSSVNSAYQLCDTYPAFLALPRCIKDEELRNVASFRKRGRLPTMSWCGGHTRSFASLWRCSQPTEGLMGNNCQSDEKMLYAIRLGATAGRNRELLVLDLRPRTLHETGRRNGRDGSVSLWPR
ncbi:MTMR2 [Symbiodinium sp. CCMP2456]|nr:MTMR2 [Symbiodinium sp. CCMP2456]